MAESVQACCQKGRDSAERDWLVYRCKLVTPMYGGGVKPGEVDKGMPIRATAIRGQLRFWWRLIHRTDSRFYVDGKTDYRKLFQAEREIWGGLGDVEHLCASKVTVRTDTSISKVSFQKKEGSPTYASFSIDKECNLLKVGFEWEMRVDFGSLSAEERKQVENAIRCWGSFGGVGARTRRGLVRLRWRKSIRMAARIGFMSIKVMPMVLNSQWQKIKKCTMNQKRLGTLP